MTTIFKQQKTLAKSLILAASGLTLRIGCGALVRRISEWLMAKTRKEHGALTNQFESRAWKGQVSEKNEFGTNSQEAAASQTDTTSTGLIVLVDLCFFSQPIKQMVICLTTVSLENDAWLCESVT